MTPNTFDASERFYENAECLECKEAIFNPICPSCLASQIEAWLASYPSDIRDKIIERIKDYAEKTSRIAGKSTKCISCKKRKAALCPYCFTAYVFEELKRAKVSRIILKEFVQFFNYDFEHSGYSREFEDEI